MKSSRNPTMGLKEHHYKTIRAELDKMGYHQPLSVDSIHLVEKLLQDLVATKEKLKHYRTHAECASKKCEELEMSVNPYRIELERLTKENNELHLALIKQREEADKNFKETAYSDLEFAYMEQSASVGELHQELLSKKEKQMGGEKGKSGKKPSHTKSSKGLPKLKTVSSVNNYLCDLISEKSVEKAMEEFQQLRKDNYELSNKLEQNQEQIISRDKEIYRLGKLIEEKSSIVSTSGSLSCFCQCNQDSSTLMEQLKEAHRKQAREAKKVSHLMERIESLERQLTHNRSTSTSSTKLQNPQEELINNQKLFGLQSENMKQTKIIEEYSLKIKEGIELVNSLKNEIRTLKNKIEELTKKDSDSTTYSSRETHCTCCKGLQSSITCSQLEHDTGISCQHKNVILTLKNETREAEEETNKLQEELSAVKNDLMALLQEKHKNNCNTEVIKLEYQDKMISLELERKGLAKKLSNLQSKIFSNEQTEKNLRQTIETLTTECANWKAKYNHLKVLNEHMEISRQNIEKNEKTREKEILELIQKVRSLEKERETFKINMDKFNKERITLRSSIQLLDKEKDDLVCKLDEKTVICSKLENELKHRYQIMQQLEQKVSHLEAQSQTLERMLSSTENKSKSCNNEIRKMEAEISSLESCKENFMLENRRLQNDLASVTQDNIMMSRTLEESKQEVENLKIRLQSYVEEVRRVDELLQIKEREREELLEQFKALSLEATNLEISNQSLEVEANHSKNTLLNAQGMLNNLEYTIENKNSIVSDMEDKVAQLSLQVEDLQMRLSEKNNIENVLSSDLEAARCLCSCLDEQKQCLHSEINRLKQNEVMLKNKLGLLQHANEELEKRIQNEHKTKVTLEELLTSSREEAMEKSLYNHDLRNEVRDMAQSIQGLQTKLKSLSETLSDCQNSCSDVRNENVQLRRDLINERYEKAKADESMSLSTSL